MPDRLMDFRIEQTRNTPSVLINAGIIEIIGRSIPEDSFDFFEPILDFVRQYVEEPPKETQINIKLEYINSGSKKYLINILTHFEELPENGYNVIVNWFVDPDDESIKELGEDLKDIIHLPFKVIKNS